MKPPEYPIRNADELEIAVFCSENVAQKLHADPVRVYAALTGSDDLLHSYIVPGYDVLHTQGKDYITDDILSLMQEKGVRI